MKRSMVKLEKVALNATSWIGSIESLILHTIVFAISFSLVLFGIPFDRVLLVLTTVLSLEAIYLAIFIQMSVNQSAVRLTQVENNIVDIAEDVEEIAEDVEEIAHDVDGIEKDIDEIQGDVEEIAEDVEEMAEDVEEIAHDVDGIEKDIDEIQKENDNSKIEIKSKKI